MDKDIRDAVIWITAEYRSGRISKEMYEFLLKGCLCIKIERSLAPKMDRLMSKLDSYLERLS
jgi:hypothetical protein